MNPVLALALLAAAGIAATRLPRPAVARSRGIAVLRAAGAPLALLGFLLGPGIGVLDQSALRALAPLTALALGWMGAGLGAQFEWRLVRRIPPRRWVAAALEVAAVCVVVSGAAWALAPRVPALAATWRPTLPAIVALGAIAAVAAPAIQRPDARLHTAFGVVAFTPALAAHHAHGPFAWPIFAAASGVLVGLVFLSVTRLRPAAGALPPAVLGVILFGAGVGYAAELSSVVVCALAAGLIVNLSPHKRRVQALLRTWEPEAYAVCLIVAGALLALPTVWLLVAVPLWSGLGAAAQWAASRVGGGLGARGLGLASTAQGGVALALALDFQLAYGTAAGVVITVLLGVILARVLTLTAAPHAAEVR